MGAFDEAVHEAANGVKPLVQALDDAQRECHEAIRYVQALGERLKEDRAALEEAVTALVHDSHEVEQALAGAVTDAAGNLNLAKEAVAEAAREWEEVFDGEEKALAGASELLPGLAERVKALAVKAETASHGVIEWAGTVSHELDKAVESVEQVVSVRLAAMVADWRRSVEGAAARLVEFFEKECAEQITAKEAQWRQKVEQVRAVLGHTFDAIADHGEKVAHYAADNWVELKDAQIKATEEPAHKLADELTSLSLAVENYDGELEVASGLVAEDQRHAAEGAAQLTHGLGELRARWATFGITY